VPSLCRELQESRGTERCGVLHRDCSVPRSEGRTSFPFQAELSPGPSKHTWWQSQLLGTKPPVPSAHQMDARVPERAAITSPASLPLRESNVAPNCAMLQSRECLRHLLSHPPAGTAWLPARTPRVSDTGQAGTEGQGAGMGRRQQGTPGYTQKWESVEAASWA